MCADIFLEEPQNVTVKESGNATFQCSLSNSSFQLLWLVDGYYAAYRMYYERGIVIQPFNSTTSQLRIAGHRINNNVRVQCAALLTDKHTHRVLDYIESRIVFLTIGKYYTYVRQ